MTELERAYYIVALTAKVLASKPQVVDGRARLVNQLIRVGGQVL